MTATSPQEKNKSSNAKLPAWAGALIIILVCAVVVLLGFMSVSIMERRWEAQRPSMVYKPIDEWESDNAVWGESYPREYESHLKSKIDDTKTKYGGAFPRDYLENDPLQVILFAGYGFGKDYFQARGHYHSLDDVTKTKRIKKPFDAATCWTCKSTDVPRIMTASSARDFYASNFHDLADEIVNPIGCLDCHDPTTMNLRISRPALQEAFAQRGMDINAATHQQMRSLVCAQCHVEYYFKTVKSESLENYLTLPWENGTTIEDMIVYYDGMAFSDYTHPISKTPIIKSQHPDYELFLTGIHAYRDVSCADCHMPYRTEGGMKFTNHHVQSPLLNIANSCAVCHRWSEEEIRTRVEAIQEKVAIAMLSAERALTRAHFDIAAAMQAGASDGELVEMRHLLRHAQFRWDYVSSSNGMGFHSPQESMRILGDSVNQAQQVRIMAVRFLAGKGFTGEPRYPDVSTRKKAWRVAQAFVNDEPIKLPLSEKPGTR